MRRFFLPPEECREPTLRLTGPEAHHASAVLRVERGDEVSVLDGAGREFLCAVDAVERKVIGLSVKQILATPAPACRVTLAQAVPRGKLLEFIIQKATELGAFRVIPLLSERVATRLDEEDVKHKAEKWRQVAVEAIKQCGQRWLPRVEEPVSLPALLARAEKFDLSLVGALQDDACHPREFFNFKTPPASVRLWIGPEGDFTPEELSAIRASGARPISLGPLVLRCDTAAVYTLSIINYELQGLKQH